MAAPRRSAVVACALALLAAVPALARTAAPQTAAPWDPAPGGRTPTATAPALGAPPAGGAAPNRTGEIEVYKHLGGPALWKVVRGDSQVFILGAATPLPHMLAWDTQRLENALDGASTLYLQPRPSFSPFELMKLAVDRGALQLPRGQTLQSVLPPAEKGRYLRLVAQIHAHPSTYDRWKPAVAGLFLLSDWRKAAGLSEGKPGTTVMHLAEDAHVPVQTVGDFRLDPYVATASKMSAADNLACFDAALDDVDRESAHVPAMSAAWAKGDLKTVGQNYKVSLLTGCLQRLPSVAGLLDRGTAEGVKTIQLALLKPGKSVAVIDLNFLLRPDGVLDRLRKDGDAVTTPE